MKQLDLHIHSKYSNDCISDPKRIAKIAKLKGLRGISITDHNTIKGGLETKKYSDENLSIIVGSEINTDSGEVIGLFLNEEIQCGLSLINTIEKIHEQDGLAIISHPFDKYRKNAVQYIDKKILDAIDGIEILNGRSELTSNTTARNFVNKTGTRIITAGSDAHTLLEIGCAGLLSTTDMENTEEEDIRTLLINGELETYQKPSSNYFIFDIIGRNVKRRRIYNRILVNMLNSIQEMYL